jgi:hypothetical protein
VVLVSGKDKMLTKQFQVQKGQTIDFLTSKTRKNVSKKLKPITGGDLELWVGCFIYN